ncbi:hypothetical protein EJP77_18670 [Paenibacillus zeisoli]|uniref:Uncharacterized protein n=1 Tax=Paenibacillus zeisoli TaxID=2496267 RepID=A0A3S1CWQ2_9BACL|nr:hypothetical protein [Paenibacillus zeisoli]RUT28040.1 hypothetical protein EJP77_18670 [Paenibacillus zeisoli]
MSSSPKLYEFEYLFECDAKIGEPDIPWFYSGATFSIRRDEFEIEFSLVPEISNGEIKLLHKSGFQIVTLTLENIKDIRIYRDKVKEGLLITFNEENFVEPLEIQTRPNIRLKWGTSLELQR